MTAFAFKRTGDADYPRYLKILLQGPPKSGKTTFISTAPNVVVAAVEAGLMSIAHLDVPYVEIDGTDKLQTLQQVLSNDTHRAKAAENLGMPRIDTVAIDTLDAWQEMLKREILKENRRTQMQQADWGTLKERMAAVLKAFVALPVNVIFTVHTTTTQDDESRLIYAPALQGSIKDEVAGYVDFSLLSYRQRDVDSQGVAKINYYLKNEGDLKNPSLGNRAAGRVPEVSLPNFKTLHDAVFKGIVRDTPSQNPTEITMQVPPASAPVAAPQETAQNLSTAPATPSAAAVEQSVPAPTETPQPAAPTGTPLADDSSPINAAGLGVIKKHYMAHSLVLPEDIESWNLGKARLLSKWFVAVKADAAAGKQTPREEIVEYLKAFDAYSGDLPGVQTGVENVQTPEKPPVEPVQEVTQQQPATEEPATSQEPATEQASDDKVEADAVALVQEQLGGVEIGHSVEAGAKCEICGNEVDDLDLANLGLTRFRKILCVQDYKAQGKAKVGA